MVKNLPTMWETRVQSLGWEDPLEEGMVTHSSILACRVPMDRGACRGRNESDMTEHAHTHKGSPAPLCGHRVCILMQCAKSFHVGYLVVVVQ